MTIQEQHEKEKALKESFVKFIMHPNKEQFLSLEGKLAEYMMENNNMELPKH